MLVVALVLGVPTVSAWVLGDSMAYRRAHNAWLEERARRAEAERDTRRVSPSPPSGRGSRGAATVISSRQR